MKSRFMLGSLILLVGLVFAGFATVQPAQAQVSGVELSASDRQNLQAVLTITKSALAIAEAKIQQNSVQNPEAVASALNGISGNLSSMQSLLGESSSTTSGQTSGSNGSVAGVTSEEESPTVGAGSTSSENQTEESNEPEGVMSEGGAMTEEENSDQATSDDSSAFGQWIFWLILIAAIILAFVLRQPRQKETMTVSESRPVDNRQQESRQQIQQSEQKETDNKNS